MPIYVDKWASSAFSPNQTAETEPIAYEVELTLEAKEAKESTGVAQRSLENGKVQARDGLVHASNKKGSSVLQGGLGSVVVTLISE